MKEKSSHLHHRSQRIIIFGAGELGQLLVECLANAGHDLTVIDSSDAEFTLLREKSDVKTICGALKISLLRQANDRPADMLLAVSGDEHANIVACQLANFLGIRRNICRLYSDVFEGGEVSPDEERAIRITPEYFGISRAFSSPKVCAEKILDVAGRPIVLEEVHLSHSDAVMVTALVHDTSPLCGVTMRDLGLLLKDFERKNGLQEPILNHLRVAATVHDRSLSFPNGATVIAAGDRLYLCGEKSYIDAFLLFAQGRPDPREPLIIVSGTGDSAEIVVRSLLERGAKVHVIASDDAAAEEFLRLIPPGAILHTGSATDPELLEEAGIAACDAFIAMRDSESDNLLGCIMAKRSGARKVIAVTYKPEYIGIVPVMTAIDCAFNATQISANTILREMDCGLDRIDSRLQQFDAFLGEFEIGPSSRLLGKPLKECGLPENVVLALLFRDDQVISPNGNTVFQEGDTVATIVRYASEERIRHLLE